jgi:GNAT superfamily N-acetyltransferase
LDVLAEGTVTEPGEPEPPSPASDPQQRSWDRMMRTADLSVYLAERDGVVVGTATMLFMPHLTYGCRPTAFIEAVVVRYAHRRRGVARRLVDRALTDARQAGCLKVQLLSHKRHATDGAHRLYEAAGFTAEAEGFRLYLDR